MNIDLQTLITISYILQALGFIGITLAWVKAIQEYMTGQRVYRTRLIMLFITTFSFFAYLFPLYTSICRFNQCAYPVYPGYLRIHSGIILFLFGVAMFFLYYTKDTDI